MKLKSKLLNNALKFYLNNEIGKKISTALDEEEPYAADELVELAEVVLHQIAAVGVVHYLQHAPQKEVYNDFLVQLFNSSGHDYNAGPLFRWAANMVKECPAMKASTRYPFFWQEAEEGLRLAERVHHLAELRNQVMHGFFVLPPEENRKEADAIGQLLMDLHKVNFFDIKADFHFCRAGHFTGHWNIIEEDEWTHYFGMGAFGELAQRIVAEQKPTFWENEKAIISSSDASFPDKNASELREFVSKNNRGAYAVWVHPTDDHAAEYFAAINQELSAIPNTRVIAYGLYEQGLSYTGVFLLNRLLKVLDPESKIKSKDKKPEEQLAAARKLTTDKVVVMINRIHLGLFSPQHVTRLNNVLYENNIILVAVGHHYEHFNAFFNGFSTVEHPPVVPSIEQATAALRNYLRFKGPSHEKADEREDVQLLESILASVLEELATEQKLYARRFADEHIYNIEYVHEVFALLHPWVHTSREAFEPDTVDELYGFPSTMTEVTPIYLALGRRDLKLEYQHKVITF
ncbi:MAG: hypothetical protein EBV15_10635 [Bacteroidetes bacterium]|nr:hypothetical protein [Bacteroidota bacterium]